MANNDRQSFSRVAFETPRVSEYFDQKELTMLCGQPKNKFAAVLQKELGDNSLDAAESARVAPEIAFEVHRSDGLLKIAVADNGPGIPPEVVDKVLDFSVRVSDKAAYPSPSRGAQGNALKTVLGIPHALGSKEPVIIDGAGVRHEIRAWLDPANELREEHTRTQSPRKSGTRIEVTIPAGEQRINSVWWARAFSLFNPHAVVKIEDSTVDDNHAQDEAEVLVETYKPLVGFPGEWQKWLPRDPISANWYSASSFQRLIYLHLANARRGGKPDLALGEFIRDFRGLSSTIKAKEIASLFPQIRRLCDFEFHPDTIEPLLLAMQSRSNPVPARALGLIGEEQFHARIEELHGIKRFWYAKFLGEADGMPIVLEAALAEVEEEVQTPYFGLNFSPTFEDPLGDMQIKLNADLEGWGMLGVLHSAHVFDLSFVFVLHITTPAFNYRDRGKSRVAAGPDLREKLAKVLWPVLRTAHQEGKRRSRTQAHADRPEPAINRETETSLKDAVFAVMQEAWAKTTDHGRFLASTRMLFYTVRRMIQEYTSKELDSNYFGQNLVPEWQQSQGELKGIYSDPRGYFHQPHGGAIVPLGTREVNNYHFPDHVFDKILYVEKKGLMPIFQAVQIGERFDIGIAAGEGFGTVAVRELFQRAHAGKYKLFVLHDADPAGYNICRTMAEETRRMPGYSVEVIDLGLNLEEGFELGLQSEKFNRKQSLTDKLELTDFERKHFEGVFKGRNQWECERIELNAFTAPDLVSFIERKLAEAGATDKVIPPSKYLENFSREEYRKELDLWATDHALELIQFDSITADIRKRFDKQIRVVPADRIEEVLTKHPTWPWRKAVQSEIKNSISERVTNLVDALQEQLHARTEEMLKKRRRKY